MTFRHIGLVMATVLFSATLQAGVHKGVEMLPLITSGTWKKELALAQENFDKHVAENEIELGPHKITALFAFKRDLKDAAENKTMKNMQQDEDHYLVIAQSASLDKSDKKSVSEDLNVQSRILDVKVAEKTIFFRDLYDRLIDATWRGIPEEERALYKEQKQLKTE